MIGKLQRLAEPVGSDANDLAADDDEEEGEDEDFDVTRPKRTSRPKRWADTCQQAVAALEELQELQAEYQGWRQNLPDDLEVSVLVEKLDAMEAIDVQTAIEVIQEAGRADPPLGFGRD